MFFSHPNAFDASRKNGTIFRSIDGGQRWEPYIQVTDDSDAADSSFAYNTMTTLQQVGHTTSVGLLYETGDELKCTEGCTSCQIVYRTLELSDGRR
eukprot:SAG31_NODE_694_length_12769_cov_8.102447_5_plen_96_part_00